jgi:hypothetical protein
MLKGGRIPMRDRHNNRPIRPGQACQVVILDILQMFFATIKDDHNRPLWTADEETTQVYIGSDKTRALKVAEQKTAIHVKRGPARFQQRGGIGSKAGNNFLSGTKTYHDLIEGSATILVVATDPELADDFANDIFELLGYIKDMPRYRGFFSIDPPLLGEVGLLKPEESRPKLAAVPVTISGTFDVLWDVTDLEAKLKSYIMQRECMAQETT